LEIAVVRLRHHQRIPFFAVRLFLSTSGTGVTIANLGVPGASSAWWLVIELLL
jgi:hypothetical protein